jgi:hypothetical protein
MQTDTNIIINQKGWEPNRLYGGGKRKLKLNKTRKNKV